MSVETMIRCSKCGQFRMSDILIEKDGETICVHCADSAAGEPRPVCPACGRAKPGRPKRT